MHRYQSLFGSLKCLSGCIRSNIAPATALFLEYNYHPIPDYLKSSLYSIQCVHSTSDLGIYFSLASPPETHAQILHPLTHYKES